LGCQVDVVCVNHRNRHGKDITWDALDRTPSIVEVDGQVRITRLGRTFSIAKLDLVPDLPAVLSRVLAKADLVHLHTPNPTMLLALAVLRSDAPLVITHHSDVVRQRMLAVVQRPLEHRIYSLAARIFSDAPIRAAESSLLACYSNKVEVLALGVELRRFVSPSPDARAHAEQLVAAHGQPLWLSVGRLVYYKGLLVAIRALPSITGKLMVIGEGPEQADLQREAARLGVADRIIWRGRVESDELVGSYLAATALWFPSNARSEGFGLVQVEAMASRCPVINTAIPCSGVPWVSKHEVSGLTVPVNDPAALAAAARRLLTETGLRERLAAAAKREAVTRFDHHIMAERSLALYRAVLQEPRRRRIHRGAERVNCLST
jgi:rhamnosyl/mannosyltransferase